MRLSSLNRQQLITIGGVYAVLVLVAYALLYFFEPFSAFINQMFMDSLTTLSALMCTLILVIVLSFYQPGEPPRQIWLYFTVALGLWTLGELVWEIYNLTAGEVPYLTIADGFWALGYVFFTAALASQYRLFRFDNSRKPFWIALAIWAVVLILTTTVLVLIKSESFLSDFLVYFYPIGDLAVAVAALILVIKFRRGILARPWLSLFAFVFSDSFYLWATSGGLYDWTGTNDNLITLVVELVYIIAYLFMGWGLLQQYIALRFGAITKSATNPLSRVSL
jgi:hypothetical protein